MSRTPKSKGFTLVEVMIVLIIIGMFVTFSAGKLVNSGTEMKSAVRTFSSLIRKMRSRARIENRTYRLVFDLPEDSKKIQSYWVESTDKKALLLSSEEREERTKEMKDEKGNERIVDPQGFSIDSKMIKDPPATLPRGLFFESIELASDKGVRIKSGRIFIYFFPQGYVQGSAVHLTNKEKLNWTLVTHPLTGLVDIFNSDISLEEGRSQ